MMLDEANDVGIVQNREVENEARKFEYNVGGSSKGKPVLRSDDGYQYNLKRKYTDGASQWQCIYRTKTFRLFIYTIVWLLLRVQSNSSLIELVPH